MVLTVFNLSCGLRLLFILCFIIVKIVFQVLQIKTVGIKDIIHIYKTIKQYFDFIKLQIFSS